MRERSQRLPALDADPGQFANYLELAPNNGANPR